MSKCLLLIALACLTAIGCDDNELEIAFFRQPRSTRIERLRNYPLSGQYKIFRYGNDKTEPPLMDLAIPIAERGGNAVPFLLEQLRSDSTDMTIRDILLIFETMANSKRYDVKSDLAVMSQLEKSVLMMKDKEWQDICRKRLQRMLKAD